jgi:hypothetical protein
MCSSLLLGARTREDRLSEKFMDVVLAIGTMGSARFGKLTGSIGGEIWKSLSGRVSEDAVCTVSAAYDRMEAAESLVAYGNDNIVVADTGNGDGGDVDIAGVGGMVAMCCDH